MLPFCLCTIFVLIVVNIMWFYHNIITLLSQHIQGHKKPSEKQTEKILTGIQKIGQELSEINLMYKE